MGNTTALLVELMGPNDEEQTGSTKIACKESNKESEHAVDRGRIILHHCPHKE